MENFGYFVVIGSLAGPANPITGLLLTVVGAVFSAAAGYIGMRGNQSTRTAQAAKTSLSKALSVSFTGGSVMGLGVAGLAVLGWQCIHHFIYAVCYSYTAGTGIFRRYA